MVPPDLMEQLKERQRRLTTNEYHLMIDAGVFDEDDHSELLHGILVARSAQGGPHARVIQRLTGLLVRGVGEAYDVRVQLPLTLGDDSEPEPDFAVVPRDDDHPGSEHPRTARLVIEVSRTSFHFDRTVKAPLYARAGVPEYWLVDLSARRVVVLRDPDRDTGEYRVEAVVGPDGALAPVALDGPRIRGRDLLA
jgi:Uma2 family endonuclease